MYCLNEKQIDFILDDIRRNGVELEDLQSNLLDHICCIIEQELEENGDFEQFYFSTIKKFYKKELREIEEETISLLTFKNYYVMKKTMLVSGVVAASFLTLGIILKFLHMPGAAVGIVLGIGLMSFVFLPLLFLLKIKEQKETKNKVLIGLGTFAGILMALGILFKIMFWPGANMMALTSLLILLFVFLPVYFFTGFRNPETKVNTVVSSILILTGCGLFLTLVRSPAGSKMMGIQMTKDYLINEKILENEKRLLMQSAATNSLILQNNPEVKNLNQLCEDIKQKIVYFEVGTNTIGEDFESKDIWLGDGRVDKYMNEDQGMQQKITALRDYVKNYNANYVAKAGGKLMPLHSNVIDMYQLRSTEALNGIIQLQMCILQNERMLMGEK
ncbi:MAG: hypothetical protein IPK10_07425 [Bacteroidetes bacterium]|nr:hypothetical protein [Bacteroidota bacterium]